ncbi:MULTISPECIES: nuclear transport factor 2 family protein [Sphingobacterium]|uniref:Lumazine-binding n=1 Tax=Sphingobacterium cellulitidis TaxID=1768011 RepID=A0A8H9G3K7_9SPHI|nr:MULTISPECIES: nuclear transport factor 2 family protein [Sphingobacterium]MBA8988064.1 hypothetical protein [Sphingobacterium soli]OYD42987.1 hypothetical protein CHT99_03950 [Sphingobacterium cellulitidis]OYD47672.1 hypothetical protein CHU00_02030 [Sphingobacterium cellulitidis]WFB62362.1 nuclear transport factor 2 family protein [Sphingobacterium sp. WM]GGE29105.1 hypothetical protein GCM10011516_28580 [Sphingobacterium soli]
MKTLISLIATTVFTLVSSFVFANSKPEPVKFIKVESIIDQYIDASNNGEVSLVDYLFTEDFKYSTPNNGQTELIGRSELVKHLKSNKGSKMNAETEYSFVEKNDDCSIVKVTTTFETFKKYDYVTLCNSKDGWKISHITVTYPER